GGTSVIALRQTEPAVFLRHFDSKRADFRESLEIFGWNFTGPIDLVRVDVITQITFQLLQKIFAGGAIFDALRWIRINSVEIVAANKKVAGKAAAVLQWIASGFGKLKRFALAFRHLRCVDDSGRWLFRLRAGFFSDLLFGCFERRFHLGSAILSALAGMLPA